MIFKKYVDALKLNKWLPDFRDTELNYCASDFHSCSDLAPYLGSKFSEIGGALSASFLRVDDEDASNKRLSYDLELRYQDNNLYVFSLNIDNQSFKEYGDEGEWEMIGGFVLSAPSELESPEFGWIMDRLEGLVDEPSEELWNKWQKEEEVAA